jgi:hypothetical protein
MFYLINLNDTYLQTRNRMPEDTKGGRIAKEEQYAEERYASEGKVPTETLLLLHRSHSQHRSSATLQQLAVIPIICTRVYLYYRLRVIVLQPDLLINKYEYETDEIF